MNKPRRCLPLITFVYLCLPLFNWHIYAQIFACFLKLRTFKVYKVLRRRDTLYISMVTKYHTDMIVSRRRDLALTDWTVLVDWSVSIIALFLVFCIIVQKNSESNSLALSFIEWMMTSLNCSCLVIHDLLEIISTQF